MIFMWFLSFLGDILVIMYMGFYLFIFFEKLYALFYFFENEAYYFYSSTKAEISLDKVANVW